MTDVQLNSVEKYITAIPNVGTKISSALSMAFIEVLKGRSLSDVTPNAKTTIGVVLEDHLIPALELRKNPTGIDTSVMGIPVDIKHTVGNNWMVGDECVGHICLVLRTRYDERTFDVGVVRASEENLTTGRNRDAKRNFSKAGRDTVRWIITRHPLVTPYEPMDYTQLARIETMLTLVASKVGVA